MNRRFIRSTILFAVTFAFVVAVTLICSLVAFTHSNFAWKAGMLVACYSLLFAPVIGIRALGRLTGSPPSRFDGVIASVASIAAVPLFLGAFKYLTHAISGVALSPQFMDVLIIGASGCVVFGVVNTIRLTNRCG